VSVLRLALFEPDIPQNAGALLRLGACLDVPVDIIEPCGFLFSDTQLRRSGMDYLDLADCTRHASWEKYLAARGAGRIVLLTSKAATPYTDCSAARAPACRKTCMTVPMCACALP
jgi:tRNA (cytidine/uridine-2'-O-)-methyltransferase